MDGSSRFDQEAGHRFGAAATVLLIDAVVGERLGGFQGRTVPLPATSPLAETWALLQAILWANSFLNQCGCPHGITITFYGDAIGPGHFAQGLWIPSAHKPIANGCRDLILWLQERTGYPCNWQHVKAHTGDPWNEAVDTVAKIICDGQLQAPDCEDLWQEVTQNGTRNWTWSWLWFLERTKWYTDPNLQFCNTDLLLRLPHHDPEALRALSFCNRDDQHQHAKLTCASDGEFANLKMVSINVLTLFAGTDEKIGSGNYISARMEAIARQCHEQGMDVIGFQETRHKADHYFNFENFHVMSGAATMKRTGGTQCWVSKTAFGLKIEVHHLHTRYADDRTLMVEIKHPRLHIGIAVLHVPSVEADGDLQKWWHCVDQHFLPFKHLPFFVLMDANSRVGSVVSKHIGDHAAVQENVGGALLHQWLERHSLWLPATFSHIHHGTSDTWFHTTGASARLDYIAIPLQFKDHDICTWIDEEIDIQLSRMDHLPTCIEIALWRPSARDFHPCKSIIDAGTIQPLSNLQIPWAVDVNVHAETIEAHLRGLASELRKEKFRRKAHLQESTWQLITAKKNGWKKIRQVVHHRNLGIMREIFGRWRLSRDDPQPVTPSFQQWTKWTFFEEARLRHLYRKFTRQVTAAVRQDDVDYYDQLAIRAGQADEAGGIKEIWREIKAALPKSTKRKKLNTRTQQPSDGALRAHFDQLEAGQPTTFTDLVLNCVDEQQRSRSTETISLSLMDFPTRLEVEHLCRQVKTGKAPGIDDINPTIVRQRPVEVGQALFDLTFKAWAAGEEPVSWKGGILCPIWKGKGRRNEADTYRGVVLLSVLGKRWHSLLRSRALPHAINSRPPMQYGGFPGQQPGFASFVVRAYAARAKMFGLSDACLFVDLRAAFHHLLRQLSLPMEDKKFPEALTKALHADGHDVDELQHQCYIHDRFGPISLPKHLGKIVNDLHQFTWYTLSGSNEASKTNRGTRPGSPYADLGFNTFMGQIMLEIQQMLLEDADLEEAAHLAGLPPTVVGWVDDIAIPMCALTASTLSTMMRKICDKVIAIAWKAGFKANLDKGKTECVATYRGVGAPRERYETFVQNNGQLPLQVPHGVGGDAASLQVVGLYTHLGTCLGQDLNMKGEVTRRIGQAQASFRMLQKSIFKNRRISRSTRFQLLESLVCTKLFYNLGVWGQLTPGLARKLEHTMMAGFVKLLVTDFGARTPQRTRCF